MISFNWEVFWFILAIEFIFLEGATFYHIVTSARTTKWYDVLT